MIMKIERLIIMKIKPIRFEVAIMNEEKFKQSDYMALQLMEIESFRRSLSHDSVEPITFQEAVMLWVSGGLADEFKSEYPVRRDRVEPALA